MFYKIILTSAVCLGTALSSSWANAITLEEATYIAIEGSPEVRQAIARYREITQDGEISRHSGYYPNINLSAGIGHETTYADSDTSSDISLTRRELTLALNQPIFEGFSTKYEIERLSHEAEAERWNALIAVENTALEVAQAYANVLRYRELVALADLNLETHTRIYGQIKLKSDTGIGRQSDLSQITARLAKAHANNLAAINNLRDAESNYLNVVGQLPPEDLIYPVPDKDLIPDSLDVAIKQALAKNPAIEGSKWDVRATESFQKISDSSLYPSINFSLERSWDNNLDGDEGPSEDLLAMFRLSYDIYSGGNQKRQKEVAVQQNVQASEIRRNTIRDTELTVRLAWAAYEATVGQKEHIRQYVISTKESQIAYEKQFRLGRRTLLDVLDSENELFQARQDYVNADYDQLFSEFRLFNAKGELMRAFRIYRPQLLGFNDDFDYDHPPEKTSASEELKAAEQQIETKTPTAPSSQRSNQTNSLESELFLEADDNSGSW
ncbi:TolC family outer membrane protein [Marinomonas dokdonensis]|uniref:TolC family outer membrane protein n=1 Tax=Marinomonas dokdonensis TaxID=328224 RepID=UPI00405545C0